jgi:hypothetical protein
MSDATSAIDPQDPKLHQEIANHGYLVLKGMLDKERLADLHERILSAFELAQAQGRLFNGGGLLHGHLNCFPGAESRFVYDTLLERRVIDLVRAISPRALSSPNVGCNLNLPGSHPQNIHIDGYAAEWFMIVNIALVDTDEQNGSMEVLPETNRREYKYWQLVLESPRPMRPKLERGDVVIRTSTLWHRGMPNLSLRPRPMMALTWEDGGSKLEDPFQANDGRISFFPNRYRTTALGRLRERAFVAVPSVNSAYRFVRSVFE